jgi:plastocyanin
MRRHLPLLLAAALVLALGVAACGGDDDDGGSSPAPAATGESGGGGTSLTLTADPDGALAFDTTGLTASAGEITITLVNESTMPHNVAIEGNGVDEVSDTITESTTELTVTLEPGEYTFYCAVPGHRAAGMEGTLTVE